MDLFKGSEYRQGKKNYKQCALRTTSVELVFAGYDAKSAIASLSCPTLEDNCDDISVDKGGQDKTERVAQRARAELLAVCAQSICSSCIYTGATNGVEVERIRQQQADDTAAVVFEKELTADARQRLADVYEITAIQAPALES